MRKLISAVGLIGLAATPALSETYKGYEMPPYSVIESHGGLEIREYGPHTVAEVVYEGTVSSTVRQGFRSLASYIFGGNDAEAKIAMTVPVSQVPARDGAWKIRFMMPAAEAKAGLPRAESQNIAFETLEGGREAVVVFSGYATDRALQRAEMQLRTKLAELGREPAGPARYYYYDDPFTVPWNRRNEVAVPIE